MTVSAVSLSPGPGCRLTVWFCSSVVSQAESSVPTAADLDRVLDNNNNHHTLEDISPQDASKLCCKTGVYCLLFSFWVSLQFSLPTKLTTLQYNFEINHKWILFKLLTPHYSQLLLTITSPLLPITPQYSSVLTTTPKYSLPLYPSLLLTTPLYSFLLLSSPHYFSLLLITPHFSSLLLTTPH